MTREWRVSADLRETLVDPGQVCPDTGAVVIVWAVVLVAIVFFTFGPMFDAPRRGRSPWPWIIGGLFVGPLSGVAYYASRRGVRMAAERSGEPSEGSAD